jgi:hypothetical protein
VTDAQSAAVTQSKDPYLTRKLAVVEILLRPADCDTLFAKGVGSFRSPNIALRKSHARTPERPNNE